MGRAAKKTSRPPVRRVVSQAPAAAASGGGAPAPAAELERFVGQGIAAQLAVDQVLAQQQTTIKVQVPTPGRIVLYCPDGAFKVERPAIVLSRHPDQPLDVELLVFDPRGLAVVWAKHAGRDLQVTRGRWRWPTFSNETVEL